MLILFVILAHLFCYILDLHTYIAHNIRTKIWNLKYKLMFQKLHQKLNILQQKAGDI